MFLADAGQIAMTLEDDGIRSKTWRDVGVDSYALSALTVNDFEVVELGEEIGWSSNTRCIRN